MKAVLVIDMPNDCTECPLYSDDDYGFGCGYGTKENRRQTNVDDTIPTWCPLKLLPKKKVGDDLYERYGSWTLSDEKEASYRAGFNDCLDAIAGGAE